LIDELLAEQQQLTAVSRFARRHSADALPAQARYYRDLIPIRKPESGEQYAFAVDLDACTGCKACVSACHSLNGLEEEEIWRTGGSLHGGTAEAPYLQTVTTACHHCVEPACLDGCPVMAYEKEEATGIVRHLDDQCIGCQYCVLKCPYDVPKYSEKRGIVRKCDMCHSRLAVDEAPACVQACPTHAISIRIVEKASVAAAAVGDTKLLPGAFQSIYTKPTTRYSSKRTPPTNAHPGDAHRLRLEPAHWPLIFMLVLTQAAVGIFTFLGVLSLAGGETFHHAKATLAVTACAVLNLGLGVSVLHLGRPLSAWRAFLGLRRSWMSREIVVFGGLAGVGFLTATASVLPAFASFAPVLSWSTALIGVAAVYCSAMIYIDTRRPFWRPQQTFPRFFGCMLLLGASAGAPLLAWSRVVFGQGELGPIQLAAMAALIIRTVLFAWEWFTLQRATADPAHEFHRSARTVRTLQPHLIAARRILFAISTVFGLLGMFVAGVPSAVCATISLATTSASLIIERYIYFTTVVAPRMPGNVSS
jgi:Fe-S-cluster-containing dehydrogenase component/DMSO reductase anchor subunit